MIEWVEQGGYGHAILDREDVFQLACEGTADIEGADVRPAKNLSERPFGPDTHGQCHLIVKGWNANGGAPESAIVAPEVTPRKGAMTAEERKAALEGRSVSMPGDGAPAPEGAASRRGPAPVEPPDELEFPDEPGGGPVSVAGALVVAPEPRPRSSRRSRRDPADAEFDSDR